MKHLKTYERYIDKNAFLRNTKIKIGDFVRDIVADKIYRVTQAYVYPDDHDIETRFVFKMGDTDIWKFARDLKFLTKNEEDLESIIDSEKYNL